MQARKHCSVRQWSPAMSSAYQLVLTSVRFTIDVIIWTDSWYTGHCVRVWCDVTCDQCIYDDSSLCDIVSRHLSFYHYTCGYVNVRVLFGKMQRIHHNVNFYCTLYTAFSVSDTACLVGGAGSMKQYVVCPSVCPSMSPQQQTRCCRLAAVGPAGRRYRSIAAWPALRSSGGRMRAVPRCQRT